MQILPILDDRFLKTHISKMSVSVLQITEKKDISNVLAMLSARFPWNEQFSHLKRVRAFKCDNVTLFQIIVTTEEQFNDECDDIISQLKNVGEIITVEVPSECPLTRTQFENCKNFWPTNFHENKYISKCLTGKVFDEVALQKILENFKKLMSLSCETNNVNAALALHKDNIVTYATSDYNYPLKHAVMCLIDAVAQKQLTQTSKNNDNEEIPYLLRGNDVFVIQEPCVMCSMALIHSRVKRLFFINKASDLNKLSCCPEDTAITSMKLHVGNKLNHRFEAWKITLNTKNISD
ncbi:hypothetical protein B4U80_13382 [Leptotrombidium deliense]|uniref:CMP/dCMP-type deaminase domain-containing protein n=1 Tax=Leptotrombidium deliense TaxID=299467 RepID=A0A443S7C6_9ACAR|nr:hypothetical protein B4U80_13382 [Leptotrombidium deliense]